MQDYICRCLISVCSGSCRIMIRPRRLTWNLQLRWMGDNFPCQLVDLGSMLIFRGVFGHVCLYKSMRIL